MVCQYNSPPKKMRKKYLIFRDRYFIIVIIIVIGIGIVIVIIIIITSSNQRL